MLSLHTLAVEIVMATADLLAWMKHYPNSFSSKNKTSSSVLNHFNFVDIRLVVWVP